MNESNMKICPNCNASYQEDDKKFCKKCGTALATVYSIPAQEIAKKSVFEDRLKADPLNVDILHEFVQFLFANRLIAETIPVALKILALKENELPALEILFQSYVKLHKIKETIEVGKQLLQIKPADIDLLTNLAEISAGMDQNKEALAYYDSALKLDPANKDTHFNKALILLKENEIETAIKSFKEAFALGNNDRITSIYLGIDKALNADYASAISQLTPVLTDSFVNPNDVNYNRGFLYLAYSLYKNDADLPKILNWFKKIKVGILKNNHHLLDESVWISITGYLVVNSLNVITPSSEAKRKIDILINTYLNNDYYTPASYQTIAEILYDIGNKQIDFKLFDDAIRSFTKSTDLQPDELKFKEALSIARKNGEIERRRKKRKTIIVVTTVLGIVVIAITAVFTFGYLKEKQAWEDAMGINMEGSYQAYLLKYHDGRYADQALELMDGAAWNEAKSFNTIESYDHYLNTYMYGKYIEDAVWEEVVLSENADQILKYYQQYPNGKYLPEAKKKFGFDTFVDPRDGQTYVTFEIGSQTWFAENLNFETLNSLWFENSSANGDIYGRLYTWDAALSACPEGWHLPSDDEWKTLEMAMGMSQSEANEMFHRGTKVGKQMKSTSGWRNNGNGSNSRGFNALPGSMSGKFGWWKKPGNCGYWWSSTEGPSGTAWCRYMVYDNDQVYRTHFSNNKWHDFLSVRCLKN